MSDRSSTSDIYKLTLKRFKPLITWLNYYNAIVEGDTKRVDTALFYYHTEAQTLPLDGYDHALVLAAKKGRIEIVKQLLEHDTFRNISQTDQNIILRSALESVSDINTANHQDTVRSLLNECVTIDDNKLLKDYLYRNNMMALKVLLQKRGIACPSFLVEIAVRGGHTYIWKSGIVEKSDVEYPVEFSEIKKALFINDNETVKKSAEYLSRSGNNTDTLCEGFKYCVRIGDLEMFRLMRESSRLGGITEVTNTKWMELCCDTACEYGKCDIVKMLMQNEWVDVNFGELWKERLTTAVQKDHTRVACYLMATMFINQRPVTRTIHSGRRETFCNPDSSYYKELIESAVLNRNIMITQKLIQCRSAMYPRLTVKWTAKCVASALSNGYTEFVLMYKKLGAPGRNKCWCHALDAYEPNPVIVEIIMNIFCSCTTKKILRTMQHTESFVDLIFRNHSLTWSDTSIKKWLTSEFQNDFNSAVTILDYYMIYEFRSQDISYWSDPISVADIMIILTRLSGISIKEIIWPALVEEIQNLDDDLKGELKHLSELCGIKFTYEDFDYDFRHDSLVSTIDTEIPTEPDTIIPSLKSLCRLSVRRSIRQREEFMSMKDAIMSLYTRGRVPRSVVEYLRFRDVRFSDKAKSTVISLDGPEYDWMPILSAAIMEAGLLDYDF